MNATAERETKVVACVRCGRCLRDAKSVEAGMGPGCRSKARLSDSGALLNDTPVLTDVPPMAEAGLVCRRLADGRAAANVPHVLRHHSPTGFEWGCGGSGPADLALNALIALVGEPHAWALHQEFKWRFIAPMPQVGGHVPLSDIAAWINGRGVFW